MDLAVEMCESTQKPQQQQKTLIANDHWLYERANEPMDTYTCNKCQ